MHARRHWQPPGFSYLLLIAIKKHLMVKLSPQIDQQHTIQPWISKSPDSSPKTATIHRYIHTSRGKPPEWDRQAQHNNIYACALENHTILYQKENVELLGLVVCINICQICFPPPPPWKRTFPRTLHIDNINQKTKKETDIEYLDIHTVSNREFLANQVISYVCTRTAVPRRRVKTLPYDFDCYINVLAHSDDPPIETPPGPPPKKLRNFSEKSENIGEGT